jgi:hypothetical protein
LRASVFAAPPRASNTTLPLESTVFTPVKPAASKQRFSSGILAFMGLTPRRKATYRAMATPRSCARLSPAARCALLSKTVRGPAP